MRIFVAGATGAIGRPLLSQLLAKGHDFTQEPWKPVEIEQYHGSVGITLV
jgi:NAD dependent epimerase/dehydratase family enzyme